MNLNLLYCLRKNRSFMESATIDDDLKRRGYSYLFNYRDDQMRQLSVSINALVESKIRFTVYRYRTTSYEGNMHALWVETPQYIDYLIAKNKVLFANQADESKMLALHGEILRLCGHKDIEQGLEEIRKRLIGPKG